MLIKFDHRVSWLLEQDRDDVVKQLEASGKIYKWVKGEDVGDTIERWALANPRGMCAQLSDWTKATYMARLDKAKNGAKFDSYKLGSFDPTSPRAQGLTETVDKQQAKGIQEINDYVPARPKARTDLKKVAEPGNEPDEFNENPGLPSVDTLMLEPTIPDDSKTDPGLPAGPSVTPKPDPLAKFKAV